MTLDVHVRHRQGSFTLQAQFRSDGPLTAVFGRSGVGKTTLVNAIGGLIRPEHGRIVVNERVLLDTERRIFVPSYKRRIGYVFQEGRLFPHLNVRQNLLFGRWFGGRAQGGATIDHVISLLGIESLLNRRPATLSGGEKQRVAIGRALLADPELLLMDEPLASLDESRKEEIYPYIERLRDERRVPIVLVAHSLAEIARLSTTIVILDNGRVSATGPAADILVQARLFPQFAAEAGALIEAQILSHDDSFRLTNLRAKFGRLVVPRLEQSVGSIVRLRVRARDIIISLTRPEGISALSILPGLIAAIEVDGGSADVTIDCDGERLVARLTSKSVRDLALRPGQPVYAIIKGIALQER